MLEGRAKIDATLATSRLTGGATTHAIQTDLLSPTNLAAPATMKRIALCIRTTVGTIRRRFGRTCANALTERAFLTARARRPASPAMLRIIVQRHTRFSAKLLLVDTRRDARAFHALLA
jgi:hypothetical protein